MEAFTDGFTRGWRVGVLLTLAFSAGMIAGALLIEPGAVSDSAIKACADYSTFTGHRAKWIESLGCIEADSGRPVR